MNPDAWFPVFLFGVLAGMLLAALAYEAENILLAREVEKARELCRAACRLFDAAEEDRLRAVVLHDEARRMRAAGMALLEKTREVNERALAKAERAEAAVAELMRIRADFQRAGVKLRTPDP